MRSNKLCGIGAAHPLAAASVRAIKKTKSLTQVNLVRFLFIDAERVDSNPQKIRTRTVGLYLSFIPAERVGLVLPIPSLPRASLHQ